MNVIEITQVAILGFVASFVTRLLAPEEFSDIKFAAANGVVLTVLVVGMNWLVATLASKAKKK